MAGSAPSLGCIATDTIEFESEQNFPPSIVSQAGAQYPLDRIAQLNLDEPADSPEMALQTVVRDPNSGQTLEYRMFLDADSESDLPFDSGEVLPSGFVERPRVFFVPYDLLTPAECHRIELVVVGEFDSLVNFRRPVEEGDFDAATWWVEVTDSENPVIEEGCR